MEKEKIMSNEALLESITAHLASQVLDLSQTKWNKLMFYIDGAHFCQTKTSLTGIDYIKLPYGPVPNNYRQLLVKMAEKKVIAIDQGGDIANASRYITLKNGATSLNTDTLKLVEKIVSIFGGWTAVQLSNFSHRLDAWKIPEMYSTIDLSRLQKDNFLKTRFGQADFGKLILS